MWIGDMQHLGDRVGGLPLRWKIGSLVFLGLLAVFAVFGALGGAIADDAKARTVSEWANIATSTATVIDSELDVQYRRLEEVAAVLGNASSDPGTQARVLAGTMPGGGPFAGQLVLVAPDAEVTWPTTASSDTVAVSRDLNILTPFKTGARYASGALSAGDRAVVMLAVPVASEGRTTSVLALVFAPSAGVIADLVASARGLAHTGHAELVDQDDRVIASTDPADILRSGEHPDLYDPHLAHHTSGVGLTEPVGAEDPPDQGQRHDMAFVSLRTVPWGFALGGSDAELSADAARWKGATVMLGALSLLVALLLVWITTRSVARPILALAAASRQIAAGDLATPVPPGGDGEVRVLAQAFDHMRDKLRTALSELAVEKSRYEGIVTSMADAVVTTDGSGAITAFNPAAAALTRWRADEAVGRAYEDVVGAGADRAHGEVSGNGRAVLRRHDGSDVSVAMTHAPITDRDGGIAGTVHVLRDVSAEAEVERMKEEFLATVSHELRTPLGFIMGYATSLLLPDAPDDRATTRRFLGVIADSSKELEELVDDLLDMTKISSGTLSVSVDRTRLEPLVAAALERARVRGGAHRFVRTLPAGLPAILADARRIEQVLHDLLDNAIKYSPDGGTINVTATRNADEIVVSVVDEGLGIAPDELQSVFERFHRGRLARLRGIAGTGLGLAICRGIIERHGGRIWAESPPQDRPTGAAIRFTVPIAAHRARGGAPDARTGVGAEAV